MRLSAQPLLIACIAARWIGERRGGRQWLGIAVTLPGVALLAWRRSA